MPTAASLAAAHKEKIEYTQDNPLRNKKEEQSMSGDY